MKIYSIKNSVTGYFNSFIYANSDKEIETIVQGSIASDSSKGLYRLSKSLDLYCFGEIDFTNGVLKAYKKPYLVCNCEKLIASIDFSDVDLNIKKNEVINDEC